MVVILGHDGFGRRQQLLELSVLGLEQQHQRLEHVSGDLERQPVGSRHLLVEQHEHQPGQLDLGFVDDPS